MYCSLYCHKQRQEIISIVNLSNVAEIKQSFALFWVSTNIFYIIYGVVPVRYRISYITWQRRYAHNQVVCCRAMSLVYLYKLVPQAMFILSVRARSHQIQIRWAESAVVAHSCRVLQRVRAAAALHTRAPHASTSLALHRRAVRPAQPHLRLHRRRASLARIHPPENIHNFIFML